MKRSRAIQLVTMGVSALALTACSKADDVVPIKHYASVGECVSAGELDQQNCNTAFIEARDGYESAYPKYDSKLDCEEVAGEGECEAARPGTRDKSWRPLMAAFVIPMPGVQAQALVPHHASPTGLATAAGTPVHGTGAASSLARAAAAARPQAAAVADASKAARASTASRGGFGSSATVVAASGGGSSGHAGG